MDYPWSAPILRMSSAKTAHIACNLVYLCMQSAPNSMASGLLSQNMVNASPSQNNTLELIALSKHYSATSIAVDNIDLKVPTNH